MNEESFQQGTRYSHARDQYLRMHNRFDKHEKFRFVFDGIYHITRARLVAVQAPHLSYQLFLYFIDELRHPKGNALHYDMKQIALAFGLQMSVLYKAFQKLVESGSVYKVPGKKVIHLDPYLIFAGRFEDRQAACETWNIDMTKEIV